MADEQSGKKSRERSPNHPVISLKAAVDRVRQLLKKYRTDEAPIALVHKQLGYKEHSGAGNQCVAALKAYDLLNVKGSGKDRKVSVTAVADRIVRSAPDAGDLKRKAALSPPIHAELWEKYRRAGLPHDDILTEYLVWNRKDGAFNEDVVDRFIGNFRETLEYAGISADDTIDGENGGGGDNSEDDPPDDDEPAADVPRRHKRKRKEMPAGTKEDVYTLSAGDVVLQWPSRILPDESEDVDDWLDLMKRKLKRSVAEAEEAEDADEADD